MFVTKGKQYSRYVGRSCKIACFFLRYNTMAPNDIVYCQLDLLMLKRHEVEKNK